MSTQPALPTLQAPARLSFLSVRETPAARIAADPFTCTTAEILAPIIGGQYQLEAADAILAHFGGDIRRIYNASADELARLPHVTPTAAVRIRAALALAIRYTEAPPERVTVTSP